MPCAGCGRQYDIALFQFGRTISCTCGARVGATERVRTADQSSEPRFAADAMLGRLARWLRALGYDTAYESDIPDAELVRLAILERRCILTRDRALPEEWRVDNVMLIGANAPLDQLAEVVAAFDLDYHTHLFTRCTICNLPVVEVVKENVADRIPPLVLAEHNAFWECRSCEKIYWKGSHVARMHRHLEQLGRSRQGMGMNDERVHRRRLARRSPGRQFGTSDPI